ncbi:cupin domain-containing protein [Streptomyces sp. Wh19]|uniref:cupin domain-containing protein n=1 Tax=Streptomyces sp. Wh19 TaxID=3076629 RepID=UPI00295859CD|nr:cupin domain-containing protein [Streptomyces sp. Wh19]MDV9194449.1 cupin domain-containing protein [Streptomyces sp. Wh19]
MATIVRGERRPFGLIKNDISGLAHTRSQVGGEGVCRWKMLMNGMHLEGQWNCVEFVVIEPGASVGEHVHMRTEEIYYIISGRAVVTMDGERIDARPGDLITTPIGSSHSIANHGDEDMEFFVTEVFPNTGPPATPATVHLPDLLAEQPVGRGVRLDLGPHFTGDWRRFQLLEVPVGKSLADLGVDARDSAVLHVLDGDAVITVDGEEFVGGKGLSLAVSPGRRTTVAAARGGTSGTGDGGAAEAEALRLIVVEVEVR